MPYRPRRPQGNSETENLPQGEAELDLANPESALSKKIEAETLILADALILADRGQEANLFDLYLSDLDSLLPFEFDRKRFFLQMFIKLKNKYPNLTHQFEQIIRRLEIG